jgi:hypothetical protein
MPDAIAVNVGTSPSQLWSGRAPSGINTLLLMNTDVTNTVMIGNSITSLVVPILPNGSISVDPTSNWYVVGSVQGLAPLVVVPNGQSTFLGFTQGLGNLAIPEFQSPNYNAVTGQGWALFQNGDASFNQVTIVISSNGVAVLIYFPTPGFGNLIGSWAASATTDQYGNTVPAGINVNGGALNSVSMQSPNIIGGMIASALINAATITASNLVSGTSYEQTITFDSGGGILLGYSTTVVNVSQNADGIYSQTLPAGVTTINNAYAWGAGAGGNGGTTTGGQNQGGGGGAFAGEPSYTPSQNPFTYIVGTGGGNSTTGGGPGQNGGQSIIDTNASGVVANGGTAQGTGGAAGSNTIAFAGGNGGAGNSGTGGSSGANSANSTAAGNNGIQGSGASGGAQPAAQTNSGRGGAGGGNGANGNNGGSPGAGGGGAGSGTGGTGTLSKTYSPVWVGSYYGPDATNGNANGLRSQSTLWQGGETASGGSANGNQRCAMVFNSAGIQSDFAGYTPQSVTLTITNQHTWFGGGSMSLEFDIGVDGSGNGHPAPAHVDAGWPGGSGFPARITFGSIVEGTTHSYTFGSVEATYLCNNTTNWFALGAGVANNEPYNVNWYGYFSPNVTITVTGTKSVAGNTTSGAGSDGQVSFSYSNGQTLVFALSPQAGTDSNGNAFAQGFTGMTTAIQPGTSPTVVETWHNMVLINGWAAQGSASSCRYKLMPNNTVMVCFQGNDSAATAGGFWNPPSGYIPASSSLFIPAIRFLNANPQDAADIQGGSTFSFLNWAKQNGQWHAMFSYPLD